MANTLPPEALEEDQSIQLGSFTGYNRRPDPGRGGMTTQIYGENGPDSDMIAALSLTKFLDKDVFVKIYFIKNASGQLMKNSEGQFPVICAFKGQIQRPKGLRDGMLACFFAKNGPDSDQINQLGLSLYQDALVYVEILKPEAAPAPAQPLPSEDQTMLPEITPDLEHLTHYLTPVERKELQRKAKAFSEANRLLRSASFFRQPLVWKSLGSEADYQQWTTTMSCCAPGDSPCTHTATPYKIPSESYNHYMYIPFCPHHATLADQGLIPGGLAYFKLRRDILIQEWAWERLKQVVGVDGGTNELDPQKVLYWATQNDLTTYIPANYLGNFSKSSSK